MSELLKRMKADAAADLEVARARQTALDLIAGVVADLKGLGFAPELEEVSGSNPDRTELALRVDLFSISTVTVAEVSGPEIKLAPSVHGIDTNGVPNDMELSEIKVKMAAPFGCSSLQPAPPTLDVADELREKVQYVRKAAPVVAEEQADDGPAFKAADGTPINEPLPVEGTEGEVDFIVEMTLEGHGPSRIAAMLGCDAKRVNNLKFRNKVRIEECRALAEAEGDAASEDAPALDPGAEADPFHIPASGLFSASEKKINAHLNALGYANAPWSPPADLHLAKMLARGDGAGAAAEALGVDKDVAVMRWRAMNVNTGDIDHQRRLLHVLRWRAENFGLTKAAE